ncbi:PIN domain-containing protein [Streptomyces sp. NPDC002659]|uniref:PIN domain-containing protein n=1 Tax=Streptomyces sp. NPDC002659 TaxID=3364656 RepID=UPI003698A7DB
MARRVRGVSRESEILDCEALSKLLLQDPMAIARLEVARRKGTLVKICAMTIPEADQARVDRGWKRYLLSRLTVEPVTEAIALRAAELLREHGAHGHKYAIDAVVAATALDSVRPVAVFTSDVDDLERFCAEADRPKEERIQVRPA